MKILILSLLLCSSAYSQNWPQASGPERNYRVSGTSPVKWSVSENENINWKVTLPEGGQSTPIIWGDKLFLTMNRPVEEDRIVNNTIMAMCFNSEDGSTVWERELRGNWEMRMNAVFSDATVCSPVTDGKTVLFCSPSGIVAAFDFAGNEKWSYTWEEGGGFNIRQHEPFLIDDKVFVLIERDESYKKPEIDVGHKYWGRRKFIRCLNLEDGRVVWDAECDSSPHYTSMPAKGPDGEYAIYTARGGGHMPPERNHGFSLIDCSDGKELFYNGDQLTIQNLFFDDQYLYSLGSFGLKLYKTTDGSFERTIDIFENAEVADYESGVITHRKGFEKTKNGLTKFGNILVGDYVFFLSDAPGYIGRINIRSGQTEYLRVPFEVQGGKRNWESFTSSDVRNSRGFDVKGDDRSSGSGWGHLGAAPPTVIGEHIFFTVMPGTVYVIKWNAVKLDHKTLVSVNDLGETGKTWTLSGFSYSDGKLYARTLKELICIGK